MDHFKAIDTAKQLKLAFIAGGDLALIAAQRRTKVEKRYLIKTLKRPGMRPSVTGDGPRSVVGLPQDAGAIAVVAQESREGWAEDQRGDDQELLRRSRESCLV